MAMRRVSKKVKIPSGLKGWHVYDYEVGPGCGTVVYGHESGAWAVLRPYGDGPEVIVYAEDGELTKEAERTLDLLLCYALYGREGLDVPISSVVIEGTCADAYHEAAIQ